jgi:hypothetical protein
MERRALSIGELETHLSEQLGALQRSTNYYDEGYQLEARRMAVNLRVMLHSGREPSLFKRLNRADMHFVDSSPQFDPTNFLSFHGLVSLVIEEGEVFYAPRLDQGSTVVKTPFDKWWNATMFFGHK